MSPHLMISVTSNKDKGWVNGDLKFHVEIPLVDSSTLSPCHGSNNGPHPATIIPVEIPVISLYPRCDIHLQVSGVIIKVVGLSREPRLMNWLLRGHNAGFIVHLSDNTINVRCRGNHRYRLTKNLGAVLAIHKASQFTLMLVITDWL